MTAGGGCERCDHPHASWKYHTRGSACFPKTPASRRHSHVRPPGAPRWDSRQPLGAAGDAYGRASCVAARASRRWRPASCQPGQRGRRGANSSRERTDGVQQVDVDGGARAPGIIEPDGRACGGSRSGGRMLPAELRCMWLHVRGSSKRREQILVDSARDQRELLGPVQSALGADSGSHSKSSQCKHGPRARCEALGRSIEKRLREAGEASRGLGGQGPRAVIGAGTSQR